MLTTASNAVSTISLVRSSPAASAPSLRLRSVMSAFLVGTNAAQGVGWLGDGGASIVESPRTLAYWLEIAIGSYS